MTDKEIMQMALDALEAALSNDQPYISRSKETADALRARLAQPEQPDFSKAGFGKSQREEGCAGCGKKASEGWALYCVKCTEREWKWLTDEEIEQIVDTHWNDPSMFIEAIEAKLKEKNHDS